MDVHTSFFYFRGQCTYLFLSPITSALKKNKNNHLRTAYIKIQNTPFFCDALSYPASLVLACRRRFQEHGLAVNVHSRSAGHHAISLLREEGITRAVLHAFDGKPK